MSNLQKLYSVRHPLQEIALRRVIVCLWNSSDMLKRVGEFDFTLHGFDYLFVWREYIENKVRDAISILQLPEHLERNLQMLVKPVGIQIVEWLHFMQDLIGNLRLNLSVLKHLSWSPNGSINYERTASNLMYLETIDIEKRFKVACTYCLTDLLPVVWCELPEEYKERFNDHLLDNPNGMNIIHLYWAYIQKGEETKLLEKLPDIYLNAFHFSACSGNRPATQYFYHKLSGEDLESILFVTFNQVLLNEASDYYPPWDFPEEKYSDVLCFLLAVLPPEDQALVVQNFPSYVFRIFLHWPFQDHLEENADLMWGFISERNRYENILQHIRKKILFSGYYFPNVIQECFHYGSRDFKKHFVDQEFLGHPIFPKFLDPHDKVTFKVILRSLDYEDRFRLVSCLDVFSVLNYHLTRKNRPMVEICVREATSSKEDRDRLKEIFFGLTEQTNMPPDALLKRQEWQRLFESIDNTDTSAVKKRMSEGEALTRDKKLCTEE